MSEKMPSSAPAGETPEERLQRLFPDAKPFNPSYLVDAQGLVHPKQEAAQVRQDEEEMA